MNKTKRYNDYPSYIKSMYDERIQKISIDAGFTCPNRTGEKGFGGCTYCNNQTFNPAIKLNETSISAQIDKGIAMFAHKYKTQQYFAYFQSYTNTYSNYNDLITKYEEALSHPKVVGLVVGTRPDCITEELLDYFVALQKKYYVSIEYGVESTLDTTLDFINRGHSYQEAIDAIVHTASKGLNVGAHIILGLPGESREDILSHATKLSELPIKTMKLHQLQLVKHTKMASQFETTPALFRLFEANEYVELIVDFLERLSPNIIVERFISESPLDMLIAPKWGLKNFEFIAKVEKRLIERDTWQGKLYKR